MNALVEEGRSALKSGRLAEAIDTLNDALLDDPSDFEARLLLGTAYGQAGDFERAAEVLASALKLRPDHAVAQYNYGLASERAGDVSAASGAYRRALALQADYEPARKALAALGVETAGAGALTPDVLCLCPNCQTPALKSQPRQTCTLCGTNLAAMFKGYVLAVPDPDGLQTLLCGHCRRPVANLDTPCSQCGRDFVTGDVPSAGLRDAAAQVAIPSMSWGQDSLASLWRRWLAQMVDGMVLGAIGGLLVPLLVGGSGSASSEVFTSVCLLPIAYETLLVGQWGKTAGKALLDVQVDMVDGSDITFWGAFIRAVVKWGLQVLLATVFALILPRKALDVVDMLPPVSMLWMLTNRNRQALHDLLAGTVVTQG